LWAFSTENWKRDKGEVDALFSLLRESFKDFKREFVKRKIRFRHIGRRDRLPKDIVSDLETLEKETQSFNQTHVQICLDYDKDDSFDDSLIKEHSNTSRPVGGQIIPLFTASLQTFALPPLSLLEGDRGRPGVGDIKANANIIKRTLANFGIVVEMDEISIGPSVTRYALKPAEGVRLQKIITLQQNLELALAAHLRAICGVITSV
jgi:DNA segregation ATPase FtsK/SpoIIIE-like protein